MSGADDTKRTAPARSDNRARGNKTGPSGGAWFLLAVAVLYAILFAAMPELASEALRRLGQLARHIVPILAVVFVFMLAVNLLVGRAWITRHMGARAGLGGWIMALAGGVLSMGPMYAWYPLLSDLARKGAGAQLIAAFLYGRAIKLPLLPIMVHYFGLSYTIVLTLCLAAFSILSGLVTARLATVIPAAEPPRRQAQGDS